MEYKDYYNVLGVSKDADEKEIKRAFPQAGATVPPGQEPGGCRRRKPRSRRSTKRTPCCRTRTSAASMTASAPSGNSMSAPAATRTTSTGASGAAAAVEGTAARSRPKNSSRCSAVWAAVWAAREAASPASSMRCSAAGRLRRAPRRCAVSPDAGRPRQLRGTAAMATGRRPARNPPAAPRCRLT